VGATASGHAAYAERPRWRRGYELYTGTNE